MLFIDRLGWTFNPTFLINHLAVVVLKRTERTMQTGPHLNQPQFPDLHKKVQQVRPQFHFSVGERCRSAVARSSCHCPRSGRPRL